MTPNVELLRATMEKIEKDPEHWYQGWWRKERSCVTSYCFAGWAVTLAGGKWYTYTELYGEKDDPKEYVLNGLIFVNYRAQRILGLDDVEANFLFDGYRTMAELRAKVDEICARVETSE